MSPKAIIKEAVNKNISIIGICDHNSSENCSAVIEASAGKGVLVIPGMEITTKEEVHIVALFENNIDALKLQNLVYDNLEGENNASVFGQQIVVDAEGWVLDLNPRLLIGATKITLEKAVQAIHNYNGLAIAAHIDREGFGIIGQLGFIPPDLKLDALEISPRMKLEDAREKFADYRMYPFICSSDAHYLQDIGRGGTLLRLETPSFQEFKMVLKDYPDGRAFLTYSGHS
jgi:predicted metal-dependent phosphoesterase TrpH